MKQAVFITGFSNWGKSSIIGHLFNRERFFQGGIYRIQGVNVDFTVESQSNDDWWGQGWVDKVRERLSNAPSNGHNLFSALCPTLDDNNNFVTLLNQRPFSSYDQLHIFLIEFKWEHHAKLIMDNIKKAGSGIPNANFIDINADRNITDDDARFAAKTEQIRRELARIFP